MDNIFEHYNKTGYLHHAYVIEGVHEDLAPRLVSNIEKNLGLIAKNNPDFMVARHDAFSIDEARALKDVQTRAAWSGTRKIFVIGADSFSHEAQNALLKTFEEPTEGSHFFIIIPRAELLLPTLRSRVLVVPAQDSGVDDKAKALADKFLESTLENRFAMVKKLAEKKDGDTVDRELFRRILDQIERALHARGKGKSGIIREEVFHEIHQAKNYLATRGASPKMLLEHIAMVI
jgi:DNA polymerase III delta prime subunit